MFIELFRCDLNSFVIIILNLNEILPVTLVITWDNISFSFVLFR